MQILQPSRKRVLNIAIMGCRGIPARYGGFETLAEQLSTRLALMGHRVLVYCRTRYVGVASKNPAGVRRVILPAIYSKHLETLSHTLLCAVHQFFSPRGVVLLLNNANALCIPLLKLAGNKVFVHVDGLEWQRQKWGPMAKAWHRFSERLTVSWADGLISDSCFIQDYYEKQYGRKPVYAAYGYEEGPVPGSAELEKYSLKAGEYLLFVGRLEPENHADLVLEAYSTLQRSYKNNGDILPLVMVGWAPYAKHYVRRLHEMAGASVRFLGGIYGEDYKVLLHHCRAMIHASSVGGTHPVVVEAMGAARPILLSDIPENRETSGETAILYGLDSSQLADKMRWALEHRQAAEEIGRKAQSRARTHFQWGAVAKSYEALFSTT